MCTRNQAFEILKIVYHACDPILGHSIHDAILYGSYARGDFTAESDIDILLTADLTQEQIASQRRAVSGVASTLSLDHDITVSVHVVPPTAPMPRTMISTIRLSASCAWKTRRRFLSCSAA